MGVEDLVGKDVMTSEDRLEYLKTHNRKGRPKAPFTYWVGLAGSSLALAGLVILGPHYLGTQENRMNQKFKEDFQKAEFENSKELYESGINTVEIRRQYQKQDHLTDNVVIGRINGKYVAFSDEGAKYLETGKDVSRDDLFRWVKVYQSKK